MSSQASPPALSGDASAHLTLGFQLEAHPGDAHLLLLQLLRRHAVHLVLCQQKTG